MSRYFSRLARKTGLKETGLRETDLRETGLKSSHAIPSTQNQRIENPSVALNGETGSEDITEKHSTTHISSTSVTETPDLSKKTSDMDISAVENTAVSSTKNTHYPSAQRPGIQTEPRPTEQPTAETDPQLAHRPVTTKNSDRPEQGSPFNIQPDENRIPENKKNSIRKNPDSSESMLHTHNNKNSKLPVNEYADHRTDFPLTTNATTNATTDTALEKKDSQSTPELLTDYPAHKKDTSDASRAENTDKKSRPENSPTSKSSSEPTRQLASPLESSNINHSLSPAQSQTKQNRQHNVRISIGQISIDIQQNSHKSLPENASPRPQIQHQGKSQRRSQARNETRLSRYYLCGG